MKKTIALLLALVMVMCLAGCTGENMEVIHVIHVPAPEDMTADFLVENAQYEGQHHEEGDLYLIASDLYAIREDGEVERIGTGIYQVESLDYAAGTHDGVPYMSQIQVLTIKGYLFWYCASSEAHWIPC